MNSYRSRCCMILTMAAVLCIADYGFAQRGGGRGGMGRMFGNNMSNLLRSDEVREELELVEDQVEELEEMSQEMRQEMMSMFRNGGGMRGGNMDEEERRQAMDDMRAKVEERMKEMDGQIKDMLLPHQYDRLKQIHFQRESTRDGVKGLSENDTVVEALGITDEQKKELKETAEKTAKKLEEKIKELKKQAEDEVLAVLTKEQREKLKELRGDSFEFDENQRGGRGGRDRGDRGGRGRDRGERGDRGNRRGPPPAEGEEPDSDKGKADF